MSPPARTSALPGRLAADQPRVWELRRTSVSDGVAQVSKMPRFVGIDLAEPVPGAFRVSRAMAASDPVSTHARSRGPTGTAAQRAASSPCPDGLRPRAAVANRWCQRRRYRTGSRRVQRAAVGGEQRGAKVRDFRMRAAVGRDDSRDDAVVSRSAGHLNAQSPGGGLIVDREFTGVCHEAWPGAQSLLRRRVDSAR